MTVEVVKTEKQITVQSEYHPDLPKAARNLGGDWKGGAWVFDIRDAARVADLYRDIYGMWPEDGEPELCDVRLTATEEIYEGKGAIFFAGRPIARATGRDSGARLGHGVVLLSGRADSGGSMKNWATVIDEGSVLEVRDVPLLKVDQDDPDWDVEIIAMPDTDKAALLAEKEKLQRRLAEIGKLLDTAN